MLVTNQCKVLIDAGFSARKIESLLNGVGESLAGVDAVLLTHEHQDHCAGLRGLSRNPHIRVFANRDTAHVSGARLKTRPNWEIFENGRMFSFRDLRILPFSLPHDAHDPVGFMLETGQGSLFSPLHRVGWITDLGYIPELVRQRVVEADLLVVEANHDSELLERDEKRPWSVKQRIRGRHGHLSNTAAFDFVSSAERARWRHVCLGHLSRDCNSVEAVRRTFEPLLRDGARFALDIIDPDAAEPVCFALNGH